MAIQITGKFKPDGDFPLMDAADIEMPDGTRLSDVEFGSTLVVTLEYGPDGTSPVASHSASEIIAHIIKGGFVILADSNNIATLFGVDDTGVSFLRCDNFGQRTSYAILEDKTCQKVTMGQETVTEEVVNNAVSAKVDSSFIPMTQAEYDALDTVDESKYYMIVG